MTANQSLTKEMAFAYCMAFLLKEFSKLGLDINSVNSKDSLFTRFLVENNGNPLKSNTLQEISALLDAFQSVSNFRERFLVMSGQKIKSIPTAQVAYFISEGRYTKLVTKTNEKYLIDQSLENLEQKIDPNEFYRVNRQTLVSFSSIHQMILWSKSRVKLELEPAAESDIIVSIDKSGEFKRWLNR